MANFDTAIQTVLANEGGYVNNPRDPGGETKYGITKRTYPDLDIPSLTVDDAKAIYKRDFWRYDNVTDQRVATKLLDLAVNKGQSAAHKLIQGCSGAVQDGLFGPQTLSTINASDPDVLLSCLRTRAVRSRFARVKADPSQAVFLEGWCVRDAA